MKTTLHFVHLGDTYNVILRDHIIGRITCFIGGFQRQDMQFDDLPEEVQNKIMEGIKEVIDETI